MDKIKLIRELKNLCYSYLNGYGCKKFLEPFDIPVVLDDTNELNGLGISSLIVQKLNIKVDNISCRRIQHQENCIAIIKELEKEK